MDKDIRLLITVAMVSLLAGCVIHVPNDDWDDDWSMNWDWSDDWQECQEDNRRALDYVAVGDDIATVEREFCEPDFVEVLDSDDGRVEVLFFRTHRRAGDGETTRDETTPLVFVDDVLVGRGPIAYQEYTGTEYPRRWSDHRVWIDTWEYSGRGWDDDEDRDWEDCQDDNRWALRRVEVGDSIEDISRRFCPPDHREVVDLDGEEVEILYFRTQHRRSDGETTRDETTPLVFVDGELTGWGAAAYEEVTGRDYRDW